MAVCSPSSLLVDARCFATLTQGERDIVMLQLLCNISGMSSCNIQTLLDDGKCFAAVPQGTRSILALQLLCNISNGGGGGGANFKSGTGDPEGSVIGDVVGQTYLDTATCSIYLFNGSPGSDTGWC